MRYISIIIILTALSCMASCKKEPHLCNHDANPVDSCVYEGFTVTPISQVFVNGVFMHSFCYNPLNTDQIAFAYSTSGGDWGIGVYDFAANQVLWIVPAYDKDLDWGRNNKILFEKDFNGTIGIINGDGTGEAVIPTQTFSFNPKWSYTGNNMIYTAYIGSQPYLIIADPYGAPLDTLQIHSSKYSFSNENENLLYYSYVGNGGNQLLGFRTLNIQTGQQDSLAVGTEAGLAEHLTWDSDGNRFYWMRNGIIYKGNMASKTYEPITSTTCPGFNVFSMARHPDEDVFVMQKRYRRTQGQDTLYQTLINYIFNHNTNTYSHFEIPIVE